MQEKISHTVAEEVEQESLSKSDSFVKDFHKKFKSLVFRSKIIKSPSSRTKHILDAKSTLEAAGGGFMPFPERKRIAKAVMAGEVVRPQKYDHQLVNREVQADVEIATLPEVFVTFVVKLDISNVYKFLLGDQSIISNEVVEEIRLYFSHLSKVRADFPGVEAITPVVAFAVKTATGLKHISIDFSEFSEDLTSQAIQQILVEQLKTQITPQFLHKTSNQISAMDSEREKSELEWLRTFRTRDIASAPGYKLPVLLAVYDHEGTNITIHPGEEAN